jgi:hypothetical protein
MIAVTMPGMIGDALSAVPAARALAERHGCRADFWTSHLVRPALDLIEAQAFVRRVVIDPEYAVRDGGCGAQPWRMENAEHCGYLEVYHLGFRETPSVPLVEYCGSLYGIGQQPVRWDLPERCENISLPDPFVVIAPRGRTTFRETFREFVRRCPKPVVEVGAPGEAVAADLGSSDLTSRGFLWMAWLISRCSLFVGLISAPYVVASGFPCTKVLVHDGGNDLRQVLRTGAHHYVGNDPAELLRYVS